MSLAGSSTEDYSHDPIVLGGPVLTQTGTLITGQNLAKYTVLGRITASGKLTQADQDAVDGSQNPVGILIHDVHADGADAACQMYTGGKFNGDLLTWDAGFTAALQQSAFDGTPIMVVTPD
jgi:hypothetical protein